MINNLQGKTGSASREDQGQDMQDKSFLFPVHPADFVDPAYLVFLYVRILLRKLLCIFSPHKEGHAQLSRD